MNYITQVVSSKYSKPQINFQDYVQHTIFTKVDCGTILVNCNVKKLLRPLFMHNLNKSRFISVFKVITLHDFRELIQVNSNKEIST